MAIVAGFYDKGDQMQTSLPARSSPEERRRAVLAVTARALDAKDAVRLLLMLGLDAAEARTETAA